MLNSTIVSAVVILIAVLAVANIALATWLLLDSRRRRRGLKDTEPVLQMIERNKKAAEFTKAARQRRRGSRSAKAPGAEA